MDELERYIRDKMSKNMRDQLDRELRGEEMQPSSVKSEIDEMISDVGCC